MTARTPQLTQDYQLYLDSPPLSEASSNSSASIASLLIDLPDFTGVDSNPNSQTKPQTGTVAKQPKTIVQNKENISKDNKKTASKARSDAAVNKVSSNERLTIRSIPANMINDIYMQSQNESENQLQCRRSAEQKFISEMVGNMASKKSKIPLNKNDFVTPYALFVRQNIKAAEKYSGTSVTDVLGLWWNNMEPSEKMLYHKWANRMNVARSKTGKIDCNSEETIWISDEDQPDTEKRDSNENLSNSGKVAPARNFFREHSVIHRVTTGADQTIEIKPLNLCVRDFKQAEKVKSMENNGSAPSNAGPNSIGRNLYKNDASIVNYEIQKTDSIQNDTLSMTNPADTQQNDVNQSSSNDDSNELDVVG